MINSVAGEKWLTYYHLERYLFDKVGPRFRKSGELTPFESAISYTR